MAEKNAKEMVKTAVAALQDKKGEDIRVIDISGVTVIADYFIIASGSNPNQVQALVDNVEEQMYKAGYDDPRVEGYNTASWVLLDYNDGMYFHRTTVCFMIWSVSGVTEKKLMWIHYKMF